MRFFVFIGFLAALLRVCSTTLHLQQHMDPSKSAAKRYILSFTTSTPFLLGGIEWVRLTVLGQSFLLHHIRKMVAVAVEVVRDRLTTKQLERAFSEDEKVDLPLVPSNGLYLNRVMFDNYNRKFCYGGGSHTALVFNSPVSTWLMICCQTNAFESEIVCVGGEGEARQVQVAKYHSTYC